jgi:hypothetical protein
MELPILKKKPDVKIFVGWDSQRKTGKREPVEKEKLVQN